MKVMMNIPQPYYNHYGGRSSSGPTATSTSARATAGGKAIRSTPARPGTLLGKMLRIDVNMPDDRAVRIPPTNPFARGLQGADDGALRHQRGGLLEDQDRARGRRSGPTACATPTRSPSTGKTGDLFIADVGQNHWEEIDFQPATSKGGENYGWKHNQASQCHPLTGPERQVPDRRRAAGRRVSAPGALSRGAQLNGRAGAARRRDSASRTMAA